MSLVEVAWLVVGLLLGLVLGYLAAMPRVLRLERELAPLLQSKSLAQKVQMYQVLVKKLESDLVRAQAQGLVLQSELDLAQVRLSDSELELVRVKKSQSLKETELAMELEKVRAQVWVQRE
jgi:hypothetical protein